MSFGQSHSMLVQNDDYLLCEKTDGLRYFLVELSGKYFFLVDRNYAFEQIFVNGIDQFDFETSA